MRILLLLSLYCSVASVAADWPQFLGPDRNGKSPETGIATVWPESGPKLLWETEIGEGFAGAAIKDGKVYILDRQDDTYDVFRVFDLETGKPDWNFRYKTEGRVPFNGSRGTPTISEDMAFAVGTMGEVYAISLKDGTVAWIRSFMQDFGAEAPRFGFAQSPLVYENMVIVAPLGKTHGMVALDRKSGTQVWSTVAFEEARGYASPKLVTLDGVKQVILNHTKGAIAVEPRTGKTLWTSDQVTGSIPDPTLVSDSELLFTAGYDVGTSLVSVRKQGDKWQLEPQFKLEKRGSMLHHVIYHDGFFYGNFNTNENLQAKSPEGLICFDRNGETQWKTEKAPGVNRGNLIFIDGYLVAIGGEDGILRLIEATPEGYREVAAAPMFSNLRKRENNIWAPMAFSEGKLVLRNQNQLQCRDLR